MSATAASPRPLWPEFLEPVPVLIQRSTAGGYRMFRESAIPLHRDDMFSRWWKENSAAMIRAGWQLSIFNGKSRLTQWLLMGGGLTPISAEKVARMDAARQMSLPLEEAPLVLDPLPEALERKLRDYQVTPARQLYRAITRGPQEWGYPGAVDLSDMGTGKTYMALAAALATGKAVIVLCPVVGRAGWERAFAHFGADAHFIGTYEGLRAGNRPHIVEQMLDGTFRWKQHGEIILILDEAQALRHDETLNVRLCSAAVMQKVPIIVASATVAISPLEMRFAGRIVGLHRGADDWTRFLLAHGCRRRTGAEGWKWDGETRHLAAIHARLFPGRGCRVRKEDLGAECPETEISVLPIQCAAASEIERQWRETQDMLERLTAQGNGNTKMIERQAMMRIWQASEAALVPAVADLVKADVRDGRSVALFVNFTDTRQQLSRLLNTNAGFYGGQNLKRRQHWEAEFQADRQHILISNIGAGGASVSLHDINGWRPRTAYIFPTDHVVQMEQATGRVDRVGGKSKSLQFIPCVAGTLSERMVHRTRRKMLAISTLNNGRGGKSRF
ncbi:MAG: hypothetical protein V4726_05790 [Verrucomicrobiota bacterium]